MNRRGALAAAIAIACAGGNARAAVTPGAPSPEISLDIDRCPELPHDEVLRLAALELDARVVPSSSAEKSRVTRIEIACAGSAVQTTVIDPITGKQLSRTMDLPAQNTLVAARAVALSAAELVITSWMELTMSPPAERASAPLPSAPSAELRRAAQDRAERRAGHEGGTGRALVLAQAAGPFSGLGVAWGGGLRLGWTFARRWIDRGEMSGQPGIDLELTESRADVAGDAGTVRASIWSGALRGTFTLRRGRMSLDLGAGARLGLARLAGTPADPIRTRGGTLAGTWAGPIAYAGVGVHAAPVLITAGVEAGQVLRTVEGLVDGGSPVSIAGRWLAGTVAVGWGS